MAEHPVILTLLSFGWLVAACFIGLWGHAERWSEKHFRLWRDETKRTEELERVLALAPQLWVCPDCAFGFDAMHTDDGKTPEVYTCPACFENRGQKLLRRLLRTPNRELKPWTVKKIAREILAETLYPKDGVS